VVLLRRKDYYLCMNAYIKRVGGVLSVSVAGQVRFYFDSVAAGYHTASQSPVWGIVRQREQRALLSLLGPVTSREVLELGCGAGYYTRLLLAEGATHIWAVDFSQPMLAQLPTSNVTAIHGDAATVDPGRSFNLIVSAGMLEFVPDPVAVLRNAALHANPSATLILLYPTSSVRGSAYRRFHRRNSMDIRLFDQATLQHMATATGWTVTQTRAAGPFSACARLERGV
jgi:SAM-dependent methyltransferase